MAASLSTRVPVLWLAHDVTLVSSLTVLEVRERLSQILPRFAVPAGVVMPRVGVSLSRYFLGALSEERLTLNGPYGFGSGGVPALSVQGTVTASAGEGTLIRLSVRPAAAILGMALLCASGIIAGGLFAILDQVIVFPVGLFTAFCMLGVVFYAVARLSAVHRLNELLECLENLLKARRRT